MSETSSPNERFGLGRWHCDDMLENDSLMQCVREFLEIARAIAVMRTRPYPPLFANVNRNVTMSEYLGYWKNDEPKIREHILPRGARVRVVMASRFGDVGITDNLEAENGYGARVFIPELYDFARTP